LIIRSRFIWITFERSFEYKGYKVLGQIVSELTNFVFGSCNFVTLVRVISWTLVRVTVICYADVAWLPKSMHRRVLNIANLLAAFFLAISPLPLFAQSRTYPNEIRVYKVERTAVVLRQTRDKKPQSSTGPGESDRSALPPKDQQSKVESTQLIQFGSPRVARVTPLGISLEIPVLVSPIRQKGRVDFLVFENMVINGTSVEIDEYHRAFDLPNDKPLTLKEPLRFYVYLPSAIMAAIDELAGNAKEWPITGVVYVFGRFRRSIFRFKRVIPLELNLTIPNPLRRT
jgi:hypothetical protein